MPVIADGRYEIESLLGKGGMGAVYKAVDKQLQRPVALKCLLEDFESDSTRAIILREAQTLAQLNHKNILKIYDVLALEDQVWIVTEWIEGNPLSHFNKLANLSFTISVGVQIADALAYIHKENLLHRDIKPQNIMIDKDGRVVIIDFGVALSDASSGKTLVGSALYMDPKILAGKKADIGSDLFSFALVVIEMLTGKRVLPSLEPLPLYQYIENELSEKLDEHLDGYYPPMVNLLKSLSLKRKADEANTQSVFEFFNRLHYRFNSDSPEIIVKKCIEAETNQMQKNLYDALIDEVKEKKGDNAVSLRERVGWVAFENRLNGIEPVTDFKAIRSKNNFHWRYWIAGLIILIGVTFEVQKFGSGESRIENIQNLEMNQSSTSSGLVDAHTTDSPLTPEIKDSDHHETNHPPEFIEDKHQELSTVPETKKIPSNCKVRFAANAWADIKIDGKMVGRLPRAKPFELKPGSYTVTLSSPFIDTYTEKIVVPKLPSKSFFFSLNKKKQE